MAAASPSLDREDPALAFDSDVARARRLVAAYAPSSAAQVDMRRRMLAFIDEHPLDAHLRSSLSGHLTASALVVDAARERGLLTHHKKLGLWLQLGGHCDGDANLPAVALREATEESGIAGLAIVPELLDIDIHPIPARQGEPEHLHYDARFVVIAPPGVREVASDESHALRWVAPHELAGLECDDSVRRLYRLVFG
jgi:8-oxo-dGTP pyrophosphatase MutT (NUDIX family)